MSRFQYGNIFYDSGLGQAGIGGDGHPIWGRPARLLLELIRARGSKVSRLSLQRALWPKGNAPRKGVYFYTWKLRRRLGHDRVVSEDGGIRLVAGIRRDAPEADAVGGTD